MCVCVGGQTPSAALNSAGRKSSLHLGFFFREAGIPDRPHLAGGRLRGQRGARPRRSGTPGSARFRAREPARHHVGLGAGAEARAEPRLGGSRPARASAAGAPAEVRAPVAADLGECGVSVAGRELPSGCGAGSGGKGAGPRLPHRPWRTFRSLHPARSSGTRTPIRARSRARVGGARSRGSAQCPPPPPARLSREEDKTTVRAVTAAAILTPRGGGTESPARSELGGHPARAEWGMDARGPGGPT